MAKNTRTTWTGVLVLALVVLAGCGDDDGCCDLPSPVDRSAEAAYVGVGPYPVGYTTLSLVDRDVAVFYPAVAGSESGVARATYRQSDPFDAVLKNLVESLARRQGIDISFTMPAWAGLPASDDGPFPVVLFSHGFGGWRLVNASLMAGIASWGFIVAAPDHIERDLNAVTSNTASADPVHDGEVLLEVLDLLRREHEAEGALLAGRIDAARVAAAGHSAGGAAVLTLLGSPGIDAIVGIAAVGAVSDPAPVPTLMLVASGDLVVTPDFTRQIYDRLASPKRFALIGQSGHNSFTDSCDAIRGGASLTQLARDAGFPIDERLLELGENGCGEQDADPRLIWSISQHLIVAHLRHALGIDPQPVGLGSDVAAALPVGVEIEGE
jgi:dienelactone hydrolase